MVFQVFVRGLDGRSRCVQLDSSSITGRELLHLSCQLTSPGLVLHTGTRVLAEDSVLSAGSDGLFPSCSISCRLLGGKGGFGSLLRGAATRAGQKKTTNFDACRDMSGRRLRHVNAEKKLKEWRHEAKERNLEKVAQDYIKNLAKERKKAEKAVAVAGELKKTAEETVDRVAEAVKLGMRQAKSMADAEKKRKRSALADDEQTTAPKRLLGSELGAGPEVDEGEDSDPEESGDVGSSEEEDDEGEDEEGEEVEDESVGSKEGVSTVVTRGTEDEQEAERPSSLSAEATASALKSQVPPQLLQSDGDNAGSSTPSSEESFRPPSPEPPSSAKEDGVQLNPAKDILTDTGVQWSKVSTAADLEVLGLEQLKSELMRHGLKCGGTLPERAARLFLLKDMSVEKLDRKHFAKPPNRR